jgi:hypothetical protein
MLKTKPDRRRLALAQAAAWLHCYGAEGTRLRVDLAVGRWPRDAIDAASDLVDRFEADRARAIGVVRAPRDSGPSEAAPSEGSEAANPSPMRKGREPSGDSTRD